MTGVVTGDGHRATELLGLVQEIVGTIGGCGSVPISAIAADNALFRKDRSDLVRRISLLSHLFEEIREMKIVGNRAFCASSSSSATVLDSSAWSFDLELTLHAAKRLLLQVVNSHCDSLSVSGYISENFVVLIKDGAAKKLVSQFHCVTWKLEKALSTLPYDHWEISVEVREQVDLVRKQLRRAASRYSSMTPKTSIEKSLLHLPEGNLALSISMNQTEIQNSSAMNSLARISSDSFLQSNMCKSCSTDNLFCLSRSTSELSLLNDMYSDKQENSDSKVKENEVKKPEATLIPEDFKCPISLELMRDPVTVATGQTYERSYIQRWIDCGNETCPKTQLKLSNRSLTPNNVLRNLISQWCAKHNIEQPTGLSNGKIKKSDGSFRDVSADIACIQALVRKLSCRSIEAHREAVTEIRSLSKRCTDNRILIAEAGAIPVLVNLLTSDDVVTQENAISSLLNLSIYENNKGLIMLTDAIPSIVQVLRCGSMGAKENAAATLFSLSLADENKIIIGVSGAIPALVDLLQIGSPRGKKDAATALFNLCIYHGNKGRAIRAGIMKALMNMLTDSGNSMVDEALTIMSVLACYREAKVAIVKASAIPVLIDLLRTGLPRNKENAAGILLNLCKRDNDNLACISRLGAVIPLTEIAKSGTDRAKRKANSLLQHLQQLQQISKVTGT